MGRKTIRIIYALALIATIWMHPSHADALQDRLVAAVAAFGDMTPDYPDVAVGWAMTLTDGAVQVANPSEIIKSTDIGGWIMRNQPADNLPEVRAQRAEWFATALTQVMQPNTKFDTALPAQDLRVAEIKLRLTAAVDQVMPGLSNAEIRARLAISNRQIVADMEETYSRKQERLSQ